MHPAAPLVGCCATGIVRTDRDNPDIPTRFRMARDAGVFDYIEKTPAPQEVTAYRRASEETGLPLRCGAFNYVIGRDDGLLLDHLTLTHDLGGVLLNAQIRASKADGTAANDDDVVATYLQAFEHGARVGVVPSFEVHVDMWSEHAGRVAKVGEMVERHGVPFNLTLDASHVVFKIDNPEEQKVQGMDRDMYAGLVEIDPSKSGNVFDRWIAANYIAHSHARSAAPANPRNVWGRRPDGAVGRGIQYPFVEPGPGEWHAPWSADRLDTWKSIMVKLIRHHFTTPGSRLGQITAEFLPGPDYGGGGGYSIFDNNVAVARWLREVIQSERASAQAALP